ALGIGDHHRQRMVVVRAPLLDLGDRGRAALVVHHRRHPRTSNVQHFGPPPALSSSDISTPMHWYPRRTSSSISPTAWTDRHTRSPSLTAFRPSTAASAAPARIASGNSRRSTSRLPGENASGRYATPAGPTSTHSAVSRW